MQLGKHQELDLTCVAKKGIAKEHSKWSPVATATFRHVPVVRYAILDMSLQQSSACIPSEQQCGSHVWLDTLITSVLVFVIALRIDNRKAETMTEAQKSDFAQSCPTKVIFEHA